MNKYSTKKKENEDPEAPLPRELPPTFTKAEIEYTKYLDEKGKRN